MDLKVLLPKIDKTGKETKGKRISGVTLCGLTSVFVFLKHANEGAMLYYWLKVPGLYNKNERTDV